MGHGRPSWIERQDMATAYHRARLEPEGEPDPGSSLLDELMTAREVAALLRMRLSTVEDYARRGLLPSVKVGRHRRFIRSELERAIVELSSPPRE
jgi:excisionase family DNA binding protein